MPDDTRTATALRPALDRVLHSDPHDFAGLYIRHRSSLTRHARRHLNDVRDADEVVQEAFLRLFLALPELDTELQALAYCRRTITNLCIDRYRADARRPNLVDLESVPQEVFADDEHGDPVVRAEDAALVRQALAMLPELHRAALVKREVEEKSLPVIADELDIPEDNVKHLLFRARRALRKLLASTSLAPGVDVERGRGLTGAARAGSGGLAGLLVLLAIGLGSGPDLEAVPVVGVDLPDVIGVTRVADAVADAVSGVVAYITPGEEAEPAAVGRTGPRPGEADPSGTASSEPASAARRGGAAPQASRTGDGSAAAAAAAPGAVGEPVVLQRPTSAEAADRPAQDARVVPPVMPVGQAGAAEARTPTGADGAPAPVSRGEAAPGRAERVPAQAKAGSSGAGSADRGRGTVRPPITAAPPARPAGAAPAAQDATGAKGVEVAAKAQAKADAAQGRASAAAAKGQADRAATAKTEAAADRAEAKAAAAAVKAEALAGRTEAKAAAAPKAEAAADRAEAKAAAASARSDAKVAAASARSDAKAAAAAQRASAAESKAESRADAAAAKTDAKQARADARAGQAQQVVEPGPAVAPAADAVGQP